MKKLVLAIFCLFILYGCTIPQFQIPSPIPANAGNSTMPPSGQNRNGALDNEIAKTMQYVPKNTNAPYYAEINVVQFTQSQLWEISPAVIAPKMVHNTGVQIIIRDSAAEQIQNLDKAVVKLISPSGEEITLNKGLISQGTYSQLPQTPEYFTSFDPSASSEYAFNYVDTARMLPAGDYEVKIDMYGDGTSIGIGDVVIPGTVLTQPVFGQAVGTSPFYITWKQAGNISQYTYEASFARANIDTFHNNDFFVNVTDAISQPKIYAYPQDGKAGFNSGIYTLYETIDSKYNYQDETAALSQYLQSEPSSTRIIFLRKETHEIIMSDFQIGDACICERPYCVDPEGLDAVCNAFQAG